MEYSFLLSAIFMWVPAGFFIAASIIGQLTGVKMRRMFGFYALMLAGIPAGMLASETMKFLSSSEAVIFGSGIATGGIIGMVAGGLSCGCLADDRHTVEGQVFIIGGLSAGLIGALVGGNVGVENYEFAFKYSLFLVIIELASLVIALAVRFVRNCVETFKVVAGW